MKKIILLLAIFLLPATAGAEALLPGKWYSQSQLELGKKVFSRTCASCHGDQGQGLAEDWRKPLDDGSYPPPPLNGSAHTWHHPMSILIRTINQGGIPLGGKMPAFGDTLSDVEKTAVIAYFQDWWPEEIYQGWIERGGLNH